MGRTHMAFGTLFTATGLPIANHALGLGLSSEEILIGVAIGTAAGVLPDIDHPDSLLTHGIIPGTGFFGPLGKLLGWFLSIPPRVVGMFVRQVTGHRGGTHSLAFAVGWALLAAPLYALFFAVAAFLISAVLVPLASIVGVSGHSVGGALTLAAHIAVRGVLEHIPLISAAVFIGYLAHLFSDSLTSAPVPWPWPFKWINRGRWFFLPKGFRVRTGSDFEIGVIKPVVLLLSLAATVVFVLLPASSSLWQSHSKDVNQIRARLGQTVSQGSAKAKIHSYNTPRPHSP